MSFLPGFSLALIVALFIIFNFVIVSFCNSHNYYFASFYICLHLQCIFLLFVHHKMKWVCNKIYKNLFNLYQHLTFAFVKHKFAITRRKSCLVFECNFDVKSKFRDFNRQLLNVKMWVQDTRKKGKAGSFIWGMGKWFSYGHVISHHWTHNCHDFCLNSPDLHSLVFSSVCCFFFDFSLFQLPKIKDLMLSLPPQHNQNRVFITKGTSCRYHGLRTSSLNLK